MYSLYVSPGIFGERVAVILGFFTLAAFLATFATCRSCLAFLKFFHIHVPLESGTYQAFYRYHGYYWWIFGYLLVIHVFMAVVHTGLPSPRDPDAGIHWVILWFGVASAVPAAVTFASCRSTANLIKLTQGSSPLSNNFYKGFFRFHSYYWLILILAVAGHFAAAFYHTGLWP